jgi:hypothetical protein
VLLLRSDVLRAGSVNRGTITTAVERAGGGGVAVVLVLKVHGYALGLPNPGLLPTARERSAGQDRMTAVIRALRKTGVDADGEIIVTRNAAKAVARVALRRAAAALIVESAPAGRLRRLIEGDPARQLRRRLGRDVLVEEIGAEVVVR